MRLRRNDGELVPQVRGARHWRERRARHVDDRRHAARRGGARPCLERLAVREAGIVEVDVPVDRARQDEAPTQARNLRRIPGRLSRRTDRGDPLSFDENLGRPGRVPAGRNEKVDEKALRDHGLKMLDPFRRVPHRLASQPARAPRLRNQGESEGELDPGCPASEGIEFPAGIVGRPALRTARNSAARGPAMEGEP